MKTEWHVRTKKQSRNATCNPCFIRGAGNDIDEFTGNETACSDLYRCISARGPQELVLLLIIRGLYENLKSSSNQPVEIPASQFRRNLPKPAATFGFDLRLNLVIHLGSWCGSTWTERKNMDFGEPDSTDRVTSFLELALRFSGKTNDNICRYGW